MVLLISYGGGHITMISRVYNYLVDKGIDAKILPLTTAVSFCNANSIDYLKIEEFFNIDNLDSNFKDKIIEIAKENHNEEMNFPFSHTLAYYGIGLSQIFSEKGYNAGLEYYKKNGRKSFLPTNFAEKVIKYLLPKAIITTNIPRMELAFRKVGMAMKIKVFAIDDQIGYFGDIGSIYSDVVFVDNVKAVKRVKGYHKSGEIIVSGNPVYDDVYRLRQKFKSKKNNNLIIILQSGIRNMKTNEVHELSDSFFENFFSNLDKLNFFSSFDKVTIRFHPSMVKRKYWESENFQIDNEKSIHQSLLNHSSVLGFTSTAIYEAFLMGCFVFNLSFKNDFVSLPIEYIGDINLNGDVKFYKENPEPVLNHETDDKQSLQTIYNKLINEVFKN